MPSSFSNILFDTTASNLPLPADFAHDHLNSKITNCPIIIQSANGGYSWKLKIKQISDGYCFSDGWSDVVKDSQLCFGDFLLFQPLDESTFTLSIYGPDCREKILPPKISGGGDGGVSGVVGNVAGETTDGGGDEEDENYEKNEDPCFTTIITRTHRSQLLMDLRNPLAGCYQPEIDFDIDDSENFEMHHHFSQNPPDSLEFSVPKTQEIPPTHPDGGRSGSRGGVSRGKKSTKRPGSSSQPSQAPKRQTEKWTRTEKEALLRAWVEISEDKRVDDYQRAKVFWLKIRELFYKTVDSRARSENSISGQWSEIRKNVGLFANIYHKNANRMRPNGSDDLAVYQFICGEWRNEMKLRGHTGKVWNEDYLFNIVKNCAKWGPIATAEGRAADLFKRTKTSSYRGYVSSSSSDAHIGLDLNEGPSDEPPLARPEGRDRAKRKRNAPQAAAEGKYAAAIEKLYAGLAAMTKAKSERARMEKIKFLMQDFSNLPPDKRAAMEKQQRIVQKELDDEPED